jgi:hypothetical protein
MARLTKDEKLLLTLLEYDERDQIPNHELYARWSRSKAKGNIYPFPFPKASDAMFKLYLKGLAQPRKSTG